jgi:hypothetical protein
MMERTLAVQNRKNKSPEALFLGCDRMAPPYSRGPEVGGPQ